MELKGKVALITGGSRGIGRATVLMLADKGCSVAINYVSHEEAAKEVLEEVKKRGVEGIIVKADVSKYAEVKSMVDKVIEKFSRIDILVNNAGVMGANKLISEVTEEEWNLVVDVNLKGVFNCCKAVVPYMIKQNGGKIVNVSSLAGKGGVSPPHYCAAKGGVFGLTFCMAHVLSKYNIYVNAVAPGGIIETDMAKGVPEEFKKKIVEMTPVGRLGKPEDIAHAIIFILENDYVLGEILDVNGGRYFD